MDEQGHNGDDVAGDDATGASATPTDHADVAEPVGGVEPVDDRVVDRESDGDADAVIAGGTSVENDAEAVAVDALPATVEPDDNSILVGRLIGLVVFIILLVAVVYPFRSTSVASSPAAQATTTTTQRGPMKVYGVHPAATAKAPAADALMSSAVGTVYNSGNVPITITGFEPIGATNIEVVGVKFAFDGPGFAAYVGKPGFPDPASVKASGSVLELAQLQPLAPQGGLLTATPADNTVMWVIVGFRLQPGATEGSLAGVALTYTDETGPQRFVLGDPLRVCTGDDCV